MILLAFFFIAPLVAIAHWRADGECGRAGKV